MRSPLVVGVLYPRAATLEATSGPTPGMSEFDPGPLAAQLCSVCPPIEFRVLDYLDHTDVRRAKARGESDAALRARETPLTAGQREALADVEVVLALDAPLDLPKLAPRLKWVQGFGTSVGHLARVLKGLPGIMLTSASGVAAPSIAEFVMARLLQVWGDLRGLDTLQQTHTWRRHDWRRAAGRTVCIVGLGAIGKDVARRAHAFDMYVLGVELDLASFQSPAYVHEVVSYKQITSVLPRADALVLAAPETDLTRGLIGPKELDLLNDGALLCNVARSALIDEDAVVAALQSGKLAAAILDVTRDEPLPPESPLWEVPGLYLSPHSSTSQDGYAELLTSLFVENFRRYCSGAPLLNVVDLARGY